MNADVANPALTCEWLTPDSVPLAGLGEVLNLRDRCMMSEPCATVPIPWPDVWRDVAGRVRIHRQAGRGPLLTEDTVRMETILALGDAGVTPDRLAVEHHAPVLAGGKLDLVVDPPDGVVIELKYPRDSRTGFSPDTMTLGELVRDFLRVAVVPASERWVVQVINPRLDRYLAGLHGRHSLRWSVMEGETLELHPETLARLPETATRSIGAASLVKTVHALCVVAEPIDDALTLYAYRVDEPTLAEAPVSDDPAQGSGADTAHILSHVRRGARTEILEAISSVTIRSGGTTFTMPDIVHEMASSDYAESTIRTMISMHLCAGSTGPGVADYDDLERVDRGLYRLRRPVT